MTIEMFTALAILVIMIAMIMSDKFSFGAPAMVACALLVVTGISTISEAFVGFTSSNVVMLAGFLAVMAGLEKTRCMSQLKTLMGKFAAKGGFKSYVILVIIVMIGASIIGPGQSAFYVTVIGIVSTIPYSENLPNSKLIMPLGFATQRPLVPVNIAYFLGFTTSVLGAEYTISAPRYSVMMAFMGVGFLIWLLIGYFVLPNHDIHDGIEIDLTALEDDDEKDLLPQWKETVTYVVFGISIVGMMCSSLIGEVAYIVPAMAAGVLCLINVLTFDETIKNLFCPLIIMTACVIGVANALDSTGFTAMVGNAVAGVVGGDVSPFLLILAFCFLTSACATLTGASIGALFIFAPIGVGTCVSLGLDPTAMAAAVTVSAWGGGFLPIDGLPAMILGKGKYKMSDMFKFTIPMYFIQIIALAIGAVVAFPM